MTAKEFWDNSPRHVRFEYIRGLQTFSYDCKYKDLTKKEKSIVRKFVKTLKE